MNASIPLLGLTLLSLVAAGPAAENLHEQMTVEEVRKLFNAEPDQVPDYNVVPIAWPRLHKRDQGSKTRLTIVAFGSHIKLWLDPVEGVLFTNSTPVYFAQSGNDTNSTVSFVQIGNAMNIVKDFFEDREKKASLIVRRSASGEKLISGNIGSEGWAIRPVPERFRRELSAKYRRSVDQPISVEGEHYEPAHHVIFRTPGLPDEADYLTQPIRPDLLSRLVRRSKRSTQPNIVYPQVMVWVDYEHYKLFNEQIYDLLEYLVPFWNGVDLRYRSLEKPKVRLNIAGIIVARDANASKFETKNKVKSDTMNIFGALDSFGYYLVSIKKQFPFSDYDLAVEMSPFAMCSPDENKKCTQPTLGLAYLGGACSARDKPYTKTLAVAVIQDRGYYDGIHSAAHEMGHLFGSDHDGTPGSLCPYSDGYIMAASPVLTNLSSEWSPCTKKAFDQFFNHDDPKCLFNKPSTKNQLPRILPGQYMSGDQQCQKQMGKPFCPFQANFCLRLRCLDLTNPYYCRDAENAPADGTQCGENKICLHAQCVSVNGDADDNNVEV